MIDYRNGKIYKLISTETDNVYIGSTSLKYLSTRLVGHKHAYTSWQAGKGRYVSSFEIVQHDNCKIILLENFPCESKDELHAREQYWIENSANCINKRKASAGLSRVDYNKQYVKQYQKQPKIKAYHKQYQKQYNQTKIKCICGSTGSINDYSRHIKSQKHEDFITKYDDLSELFQLEMLARFKTALASIKLKAIKL